MKKENICWNHEKRVILCKEIRATFGKYDIETWQRNSFGRLDITAKSPKGMGVKETNQLYKELFERFKKRIGEENTTSTFEAIQNQITWCLNITKRTKEGKYCKPDTDELRNLMRLAAIEAGWMIPHDVVMLIGSEVDRTTRERKKHKRAFVYRLSMRKTKE